MFIHPVSESRSPEVSVLLPVYNAAPFLPAALASMARQRGVDFEVIAVDDGSTDASAKILSAQAEADPRFIVLRRPHRGVVGALQEASAMAKGRFFARFDADDIAHPDRLGAQAKVFRSHPETGVLGTLVRSFPRGRVREGYRVYEAWVNSLVTHEQIVSEIFIESPIPHPSAMMRRKVYDAVGGYRDCPWPEDYDLWLRCLAEGVRFGKVPRVLHFWRDDPGRLSRRSPRYALENFLRAKAHYLVRGVLPEKRPIVIWGAGMVGRRLGKHLQREGARLHAYVDIDPAKIGRTRRGAPVQPPPSLAAMARPFVLAAVGSRGARALIRAQLTKMGFVEGRDYLAVA